MKLLKKFRKTKISLGTQHQFIVLSQSRLRQSFVIKRLNALGRFPCYRASTVEEAVQIQKYTWAHCIIFDREMVGGLHQFFERFMDMSWFVPVAKERNNYDVIDAINSHRSCNYILEPLTESKLADTVEQLDNLVNER